MGTHLDIGLLLASLSITACCFGQAASTSSTNGNYPSQEQRKYYEQRQFPPFKPVALSFIDSLRYDHIVIREQDTENKYTKRYEPGVFSRPILDVNYRGKPSSIYWMQVLRCDSLKNLKVTLFWDSRSEETSVGYWVAVSTDRGKSWTDYYTGLTEDHFYHIKRMPRIHLIKNDSTLQVEFAIVRQVGPSMLPISDGDFELVKDNLVMEISLNKLASDRDHDGVTDILERKFFTNPMKADTDGDGMDDLLDRNPRNKGVFGKYSALYAFLLDCPLLDSAFISFSYGGLPPGFSVDLDLINFPPNRYLFPRLVVTDDPNLIGLTGSLKKYILMTSNEFVEYKRQNQVSLRQLYVSPMFAVDNRPGWWKIDIDIGGFGINYLIIERKDGWIVKSIGSWII